MKLTDFIERHAETVATIAHSAIGQVRKYTNEPYIVHPRAVVELVKTSSMLNSEMIAAAWLHDVVEDTSITADQINEWFGPNVGKMVAALTNCDVGAGNRDQRFLINHDRLSLAGPLVQTIKVCDLIDNTSTIVKHDPKFARVYLAEKMMLLSTALFDADLRLWSMAYTQCQDAMNELEREAA